MIKRHRTNQPMQRVRLEVPTNDGMLIENVYELYTLVTDRWKLGRLTIWMWQHETDVQRRPIHELIRRACGGSTREAVHNQPEVLNPACNGCGNAFSCTYPDCEAGR